MFQLFKKQQFFSGYDVYVHTQVLYTRVCVCQPTSQGVRGPGQECVPGAWRLGRSYVDGASVTTNESARRAGCGQAPLQEPS